MQPTANPKRAFPVQPTANPDWHMTFNLNKCEYLVVSNIRSPLYTEYRINDHSIHKVSTAKYLGVIIDHNLSWSDHIGAVSRN